MTSCIIVDWISLCFKLLATLFFFLFLFCWNISFLHNCNWCIDINICLCVCVSVWLEFMTCIKNENDQAGNLNSSFIVPYASQCCISPGLTCIIQHDTYIPIHKLSFVVFFINCASIVCFCLTKFLPWNAIIPLIFNRIHVNRDKHEHMGMQISNLWFGYFSKISTDCWIFGWENYNCNPCGEQYARQFLPLAYEVCCSHTGKCGHHFDREINN